MPLLRTRVYVRGGRIAHLLDESASPNSGYPALCGAAPAPGDVWYGTGTWDETDRAEHMPTCRRCESR